MAEEREMLKKYVEDVKKDLGLKEAEEGENMGELDITTPYRDGFQDWFLRPIKRVLYPIQKQMRQGVILLRIATSVLIWEESYFAFWITAASFLVSILLFEVPFGFIVVWVSRIAAWTLLGPWMMLVDRWYVKSSDTANMTDEERNASIKDRLRRQTEQFIKKASNYQIRKEDAQKLKSFKNYMFGTYHVRVPPFAERRFRNNPLPESFAEPYNDEKAAPVQIVERKCGQKVWGDMIPQSLVKKHRADSRGSRRSLMGQNSAGHVIASRTLARIKMIVPNVVQQEVAWVGEAVGATATRAVALVFDRAPKRNRDLSTPDPQFSEKAEALVASAEGGPSEETPLLERED